jgi:hypothetical protein
VPIYDENTEEKQAIAAFEAGCFIWLSIDNDPIVSQRFRGFAPQRGVEKWAQCGFDEKVRFLHDLFSRRGF